MALLLACAVAAAGCLSGPADPSAGQVPTPSPGITSPKVALAHPINLTACLHADLYMPVEASKVAPFVPDDFAVSLAGGDGQPLALMFAGVIDCSAYDGPSGSGPAAFGWLDVAVIPRGELANGGADIHLLRLEHYVGAGPMELDQRALGDRHQDATISASLDLASPGFTIVAANATLGGAATLAGLLSSAPFDGFVIREFGFADGGYSYVDITVRPDEPTVGAMAGTLQATPGTERILGNGAPGTLVTARFSFTDGGMGYLPTAP